MTLKVSMITGSREWPPTLREPIHEVLVGTELLIVGDEPNGVDVIALDFALANDAIVHVYCASHERFDLLNGLPQVYVEQASDWRKHGKRKGNPAGPIRNARMVKAAVDMQMQLGCKVPCYAFPLPGSRGTLDCMDQARRAGLEVIPYPKVIHETD